MRIEIETHRPAGKPSARREDLKFYFNPGLLTGNYQLPDVAQAVLNEQFRTLQADVTTFIDRAATINTFFPDLLVGNYDQQREARVAAERAIVEPGSLNDFYASLQPSLGEEQLPPVKAIDHTWALYRWLQVQFLFGVDLYVRYHGRVPREPSPKVFKKVEHDVLDAQLLMLACLEGAFATQEKKLQRWWRLLCPTGALFE